MLTERPQQTIVISKFKKHFYGKQSFSYYGAHFWNILPNDLKRFVDVQTFWEMLCKTEGPDALLLSVQLPLVNLLLCCFHVLVLVNLLVCCFHVLV